MSDRDLTGFAVVALVAWLTGQPCPRTLEYIFSSADGARGRLATAGKPVWRKITFTRY